MAKKKEDQATPVAKKAAEAEKKYARLPDKLLTNLPAAPILLANEKIMDLFARGKKRGRLDSSEMMEVLDEIELDSEQMEKIYADINELKEGQKKLNVRDWLFRRKAKVGSAIVRGLGLILLLPLFIVSIIPTSLMFIVPELMLKKMIKDQMFVSTFRVAVSALITVPISLIIPVVFLWIYLGFWWALGYFIAFPLMFLLAWNYMRLFMKFLGTCSFVTRKNRARIKKIYKLRLSVFNRLDALLK